MVPATDDPQMGVDDKVQKIEKVIGIISDTHGLLRPEAVEALRDVDLILHAGDVGSSEVLETLKQIAPVVAVPVTIARLKVSGEVASAEVVELLQ